MPSMESAGHAGRLHKLLNRSDRSSPPNRPAAARSSPNARGTSGYSRDASAITEPLRSRSSAFTALVPSRSQ